MFFTLTYSVCWPADMTCVNNIDRAKQLVNQYRSLNIIDGFKLSVQVDLILKNPYECIFKDNKHLRSKYVDYTVGMVINEQNYKKQPLYTDWDWALRIATYETQLNFCRLLKHTDKNLLSKLLGYNCTAYPDLNTTVNCFNCLSNVDVDVFTTLGHYSINFDEIPHELLESYFGRFYNTTNGILALLDEYKEEVRNDQETIRTILIAVIPVTGTLIVAIVTIVCNKTKCQKQTEEEPQPSKTTRRKKKSSKKPVQIQIEQSKSSEESSESKDSNPNTQLEESKDDKPNEQQPISISKANKPNEKTALLKNEEGEK